MIEECNIESVCNSPTGEGYWVKLEEMDTPYHLLENDDAPLALKIKETIDFASLKDIAEEYIEPEIVDTTIESINAKLKDLGSDIQISDKADVESARSYIKLAEEKLLKEQAQSFVDKFGGDSLGL